MAAISPSLAPTSGLLRRLKDAFSGLAQCKNIRLRESFQLSRGKVRVPFEGFPIQIVLGDDGKRLHLYPEQPLSAESSPPTLPGFLVIDPDRHFSSISGFLRLPPGSTLTLGRQFADQQALFDYPPNVAERHVQLTHDGAAVVFKALSGARTCVAPVLDEQKLNRIAKLRRLREIFGGPIELLSKEEALALLGSVNELLLREKYRPLDSRGLPGGLISLPKKLTPIIVGDLHAQVDNLLAILSQNGFLEALERGEACLVVLGDAPHSEVDGHMEEMDDSMLLMDLIFRLKVRFPDQMFYIRGNHDSFREEVAKDGIPQGLLWARALKEARGKAYRKAMDTFYQRIAYVAMSRSFVAAHAAPPKTKVTRDMLVNIHRYPGLIPELITNRMYRSNRPAGYTKGDIKRLRKSLDLPADTPLIVGHTPLDRTETFWLNAGGMENHHILYSASTTAVGVFTQVGDRLTALRYPAEALVPVVNNLPAEPASRQTNANGEPGKP